jgi:hypothetical protein
MTGHNDHVAAGVTERAAAPAGRRRAEKAPTPRLPYALLRAFSTVLAGAAWVLLVRTAITLGRAAHDVLGWGLTVAATVGATMCLLLVFALLARLWVALRRKSRYQPRRAAR